MRCLKLDINTVFVIKLKRIKKILLSFSFLRFRIYRYIYLFYANKCLSAERLSKKYNKFCSYVPYDSLLCLVSNVYNRSSDNFVIADMLAGLLQAGNRHEEAYLLVKNSCILRKKTASAFLSDDYESKVSGSPLGTFVQISGYFYSGSGAVLDYLKGYKNSIKWAPGCEARIVKFPGGLGDLYLKLKSDKVITIAEIVDLYLHIVGSFYVTARGNQYNKYACVNRDSKKVLDKPQSVSYVYELLILWEALREFSEKKVQTEKEFLHIVRHGLHRAFNSILFFNKAELLLMDQMVTAWRMPDAVLLPPSRFIVVHRDPRDQYVDANSVMGDPGRSKWTADEFIKVYKSRRALVREWIPKLEADSGHTFLQISFDEFVNNPVEQKEIIDNYLKLEKADYCEKMSGFNPDVSRKNVGKYKKYLKQEVQLYFKENIPEFCRD
ncbi:MAG: hypothetical protein JXK07_11295 [Spirochaetes bacterium]|nr:hypothetical protein [Spirochaetota bacterium]MBN2772451.1 hypothetical protein [Spirochaetota bacterium]